MPRWTIIFETFCWNILFASPSFDKISQHIFIRIIWKFRNKPFFLCFQAKNTYIKICFVGSNRVETFEFAMQYLRNESITSLYRLPVQMAHVIKDTVEQLPVLIIQFIKQWFCIYIKICKALTVLKESKISGTSWGKQILTYFALIFGANLAFMWKVTWFCKSRFMLVIMPESWTFLFWAGLAKCDLH